MVKDALGKPLIPGSSFKGAMRSRLEAFLRGIHPDFAKDPSALVSREMTDHVKTLKENHKDDDQKLTDALDGLTDEVSKVFGAPWKSSKFQVRDLTVKPETWFGQYQERDGVSINRDTETAEDGRLYDFQVVPAGVKFEFQAIFENAEYEQEEVANPDTNEMEHIGYWELGLVMTGLQQFKMQQIPLGGGGSRGLGVVELAIEKLIWVDPQGDRSLLLDYLGRLSRGDLSHYTREAESIDALIKEWSDSLVMYLGWAASQRIQAELGV